MTPNMMERPKGVHTGREERLNRRCPHPREDPGGFNHEPRPLQTPFSQSTTGISGDTTYAAEEGPQKARCRSRGRADNIPRDLQRQQDRAGGTGDPLLLSVPGWDPGAGTAQQHPPWSDWRVAASLPTMAEATQTMPSTSRVSSSSTTDVSYTLAMMPWRSWVSKGGVTGWGGTEGTRERSRTFLDPANPSDSVKK